MTLDVSTRIPLTFHGTSFALADIDSFTGDERIPLLSGGSSIAVVDARANGGSARVPLLSGTGDEGASCSLDDLMNFVVPSASPFEFTVLSSPEGLSNANVSSISNDHAETGFPLIGGYALDGENKAQPLVWKYDGSDWTVATLSLPDGMTSGKIMAVSRNGTLGLGSAAADSGGQPVIWIIDTGESDLISLPEGYTEGAASGIDLSLTMAVGHGTDADGLMHALVWVDGDPTDLGSAEGFRYSAYAIDDEGTLILGTKDDGDPTNSVPVIWLVDDGPVFGDPIELALPEGVTHMGTVAFAMSASGLIIVAPDGDDPTNVVVWNAASVALVSEATGVVAPIAGAAEALPTGLSQSSLLLALVFTEDAISSGLYDTIGGEPLLVLPQPEEGGPYGGVALTTGEAFFVAANKLGEGGGAGVWRYVGP